jgi:hypothetical protein
VALRYGLLALLAAVAIGPIATRLGLGACLVFSVPVVALHLGTAFRRTLRVPWRLGDPAPDTAYRT